MNNYEHRKSTVTLKIKRSDGTPLKNTEVVVRQTKHKFLFGCAEFSVVPFANNELQGKEKEKSEIIFEKFLDLFNFATLPFYWARFEPVKGKPDTLRLKNAAKWLISKGCTVKGHRFAGTLSQLRGCLR